MSQLSHVYITFLSQLYGLPIDKNYFPMNFISFDEVKNLFQTKQVGRFEIEPIYQVWAGNPDSQNRIVTVYTKNDQIYLVKAFYHSDTKQIFPPTI
jgi:hypothetical protein